VLLPNFAFAKRIQGQSITLCRGFIRLQKSLKNTMIGRIEFIGTKQKLKTLCFIYFECLQHLTFILIGLRNSVLAMVEKKVLFGLSTQVRKFSSQLCLRERAGMIPANFTIARPNYVNLFCENLSLEKS